MRKAMPHPSTPATANLASLLTPARIALDVQLTRPADAIIYAAGLLSGQLGQIDGRVSASTAELYWGLWQRAQLSVPQIAHGIALIDARIASAITAKAAILRLAEPMAWIDGAPAIHTIIACIGPAQQPRQHLDAIHMIRAHFADHAQAQAITTASSAEAYYQPLQAADRGPATALFLTTPFRRVA